MPWSRLKRPQAAEPETAKAAVSIEPDVESSDSASDRVVPEPPSERVVPEPASDRVVPESLPDRAAPEPAAAAPYQAKVALTAPTVDRAPARSASSSYTPKVPAGLEWSGRAAFEAQRGQGYQPSPPGTSSGGVFKNVLWLAVIVLLIAISVKGVQFVIENTKQYSPVEIEPTGPLLANPDRLPRY